MNLQLHGNHNLLIEDRAEATYLSATFKVPEIAAGIEVSFQAKLTLFASLILFAKVVVASWFSMFPLIRPLKSTDNLH